MNSYASKLERFKGRRESLTEQREGLSAAVLQLDADLQNLARSHELIQDAAVATQSQLKFHIESIVSMALAAVFAEPYEFVLEFEIKRGQSEARCWFKRDGELVDPVDATGGGAVDIAAFALRVTMWSIARPRSRPTIILDEPFRFVSRDLQAKAGVMMKELSDKLGLQFIMVTHNADLIDAADNVIGIKMKDGKSFVDFTTGVT